MSVENYWRSPSNRRLILAQGFVNATSKPVSLYDEQSGEIITFDPVARHQRRRAMATLLASAPDNAPLAFFITEKHMVNRFRDAGRSMTDVAYILTSSAGRHDAENPHVHWDGQQFSCTMEANRGESDDIFRLVSAEDHTTEIRLSDYTPAHPLYVENVATA